MISVYDFFSGCGGASQGFKEAGMKIELGIDVDVDAAKSFQFNFPEANFINKDIRKIVPEDICEYINKENDLLFCGCAPCQPFSNQNKNKNKNDKRINLLSEFSRFVVYFKPDFIFVENVPGIQSIDLEKGPLVKFCDVLHNMNYEYKIKVVSASDFGVPQPRKRLILIASKTKGIEFPKPTHGKSANRPYSVVSDWIGELPPLEAGETDSLDKDHCAASLSELNLKRIRNTPEGGDRRNWPEALKLDCHSNHSGHTDVYGRLSFEKMSSTLTTRCISYSNGRYGHPVQDRAISVREAACLQTFNRSFHFCGNLSSKAKQIGNAVPPLLSYNFGLVFVELAKKG